MIRCAARKAEGLAQRSSPCEPCLVEFLIALGAALGCSREACQPECVAPATMVGAKQQSLRARRFVVEGEGVVAGKRLACRFVDELAGFRSEEHTSELQSLMCI